MTSKNVSQAKQHEKRILSLFPFPARLVKLMPINFPPFLPPMKQLHPIACFTKPCYCWYCTFFSKISVQYKTQLLFNGVLPDVVTQ